MYAIYGSSIPLGSITYTVQFIFTSQLKSQNIEVEHLSKKWPHLTAPSHQDWGDKFQNLAS